VPAEDRVRADERVLPPDERDGPTEVNERPLGAVTEDRPREVDDGDRPELEIPVGGTTTGRLTDDRPELVLGATSCRPPMVELDGAEVVGEVL